MPYDFEYPIDDNTLFILLALRYQSFVELSGLDSIYDETVNYDYTLLRKSSIMECAKDLGKRAIEWIEQNFDAEIVEEEGRQLLLVNNAEKLRSYLYDYFAEFRTYKNYYHTLEEHKSIFVEFIKNKFQDIVEWRKKFTYDFTPDTQYKMIQYIGYLMHHKILAEPDTGQEVFSFNNGERGYKKVIALKFVDGCNIKNFELGRKDRGIFYILSNDKNVYISSTDKKLDIPSVEGLALLRKCVEKDLLEITVDTYRNVREEVGKNKKQISDNRIKKYLAMLNKDIQNITGLNEKQFIYSPHRNGIWVVDLE